MKDRRTEQLDKAKRHLEQETELREKDRAGEKKREGERNRE